MRRLVLAGMLLAPALALAQPKVYRCGQTYQQAPCAEGRAVEVDDARSEAQRRAAQSVARDEAKLGTSLERDRERREKTARPAGAVGIGAQAVSAPASAPAKARKRGKGAKAGTPDKDFVAIEPRKREAKR